VDKIHAYLINGKKKLLLNFDFFVIINVVLF